MAEQRLFEVHSVPFSRHGSYLAVSQLAAAQDRPAGLYLRHIRGNQSAILLRIEVTAGGNVVPFEAVGCPELLQLMAAGGSVDLCLAEPDVLRLRGRGLGVRLMRDFTIQSAVIPAGAGRWRLICFQPKLMLRALAGQASMHAPWELVQKGHSPHQRSRCVCLQVDPADDGLCEVAVDRYESDWEPKEHEQPFEQAVAGVRQEFERWHRACAAVPDRYDTAREMAAYITWSACVPAAGNFDHPAMLASKNWMSQVWNWDNCFSAWASTYRDPEYAWRQFMLHLRHQHPSGQLGDGISELDVQYTHTKPPVQGWILQKMRTMAPKHITRERLAEAYPRLCAATRWWQRYRDDDGDGIVQCHHGNDSGWDNATCFDIGAPVESPDLTALLILQMEALAEVAGELGLPDAQANWSGESKRLLQAFLAHSWDGRRFVAPTSGDHCVEPCGDSLLNFMPIVLGRRLPPDVRSGLIAGLREPGRFLCPWGLTSESQRSELFLETGYWRGAVWAAPILMAADGLADCGQRALAADLARRFCDTCARHGFAENFNGRTGEPACDLALTWTASCFLLLAAAFLHGATGST